VIRSENHYRVTEASGSLWLESIARNALARRTRSRRNARKLKWAMWGLLALLVILRALL